MAFSRVTLIKRIRALLNDNPFPDACTEAMDTTEVGLDVALLEKYDVGSLVEFQDDGEQCLVTALSAASGAGTLTVIRNYNLSITATAGTGTTHSSGAAIVRDPIFTFVQIQEAIEATLRSFWPYVYKEVALSLTPNTDGNQWYNVTNGDTTGEIMEISSAVQIVGSGAQSRVFRYGERGDAYGIMVYNNLPTSKVTSGQGIHIPHLRDATATILVNGIGRITAAYSAPSYTDIEEGVQTDCVTYLAIGRLVASTDIRRATQDDVTMGEATVVAGRRTEVAAYWESKGIAARNQWKEELRIRLPRMRTYNRGRASQWRS